MYNAMRYNIDFTLCGCYGKQRGIFRLADSTQPGPMAEIPDSTDFRIGSGGQEAFRIRKSPDGKFYFWQHEINLYKNTIFLFLMWKIFFFIWLGVALFVMSLFLFRGDLSGAFYVVRPMFFVLIFLLCLVSFSYYVYALMMGGKYSVLFVMDSKGINHIQLPTQYKKAQKIGILAMLAGLAAGNVSAAGAGQLATSKQAMHTSFKIVKSIKINRKKYIIKLRSADLMHNQVYTAPEDFDFVLGYIREHIPQITKD